MKPQAIGIISLAGFCLFCQSCSSITMLRIEELKQVEAHVDSLGTKLTRKIDSLEQRQNDVLRAMRADQQVRFGELEKRLSTLEAVLTESQDRLSKIDEKTQELKQRMVDKAKADSTAASVANAEVENLFQIAYGDFSAGRYDLAMNGFKDLASRFGDQPRGEESAFWIAECAYAQKDLANAEKGYINFIKSYPNGKKVCGSLYKLGLIYEKQGTPKKMKMVWEKLKAQCPDSEEAKAAASREGKAD
jgi:TolA-binding protein